MLHVQVTMKHKREFTAGNTATLTFFLNDILFHFSDNDKPNSLNLGLEARSRFLKSSLHKHEYHGKTFF
jgi:hypothetical protein